MACYLFTSQTSSCCLRRKFENLFIRKKEKENMNTHTHNREIKTKMQWTVLKLIYIWKLGYPLPLLECFALFLSLQFLIVFSVYFLFAFFFSVANFFLLIFFRWLSLSLSLSSLCFLCFFCPCWMSQKKIQNWTFFFAVLRQDWAKKERELKKKRSEK